MYKKETWVDATSLTIPMDESRLISASLIEPYTITTSTITTSTVSLDQYMAKSLKPFRCEHCGGTSYSMKDGRNVCDYCGSTLILSKD